VEKQYLPITLGAPGEDISTKDIYTLIQRFKNLNQFRLRTVQNFLQPRQRHFLDLLPLILHQNQALLPGFISTETPAGIPDYAPGKEALIAAKQFSKSYRYTRKALLNYQIEGLFLMGSVGSIAFSRTSDMDIWLCHDPKLSSAAIAELQQKANSLEKWAQELQVEAHFFLINSDQFRSGRKTPLSSESSGSTQHYLLLEEFYRTAIYLAGKAPVWWLVPPTQEQHYRTYVDHLLDNRFISQREVIDFGGLENPPADEFISATLWHIYKSLASPYKSLLKLFLMECYASEYPQPQWLCLRLKSAIYSGQINIDKLDPYLMIYDKVEEYLHLVASQKQLQLSRQCFYLKIMGYSPSALDPHSRKQREQLIIDIARQSDWPEYMLDNLGKQRFWDIKKATEEHAIIREQLKHSLHIILRFAGQYAGDTYRKNHDLKLIGRKLHSFLERKPGKTEIITTRSTILKREAELTVVEIPQQHAESLWRLYCGNIKRNQIAHQTALTDGESLLEILCWLIVNHLYHPNLAVNLLVHNSQISQPDCQKMLLHLVRFLQTQSKNEESLIAFEKPNQFTSTLLFINLGETLPIERDNGQMLISHRSDPLSYGDNRLCFVHRIDQVSVSTWGEITTTRHNGPEGLLHCLIDIFNNSKQPLSTKSLIVHCYSPLRAHSIILRINTIFSQLLKYFTRPTHKRYVLAIQNHYLLFRLRENVLCYSHMESSEMLLQELSSTQQHFSPLQFDPYVLSETVIPFLYDKIAPNTIQVFFQVREKEISLYVIDEKAALYTRTHLQTRPELLLGNYAAFLSNLIEHHYLLTAPEIHFAEIHRNSRGIYSCHPVKIKAPLPKYILNIRIAADMAADKSSPITIFCNDKEFSSSSNSNVFAAVRKHILTFRTGQDDYPFHINDIDVPGRILGVTDIKLAHTIHYLRYKEKIEQRLLN
jgi:adenylate cyclase, class 1